MPYLLLAAVLGIAELSSSGIVSVAESSLLVGMPSRGAAI
jgi:hypothetical protein